MIISKNYGPQFDKSDGTVGETQLVKRYMLVNADTGAIFTASQGRYTRETRELAEEWAAEVVAQNPPSAIGCKLAVESFWCWPGHFDPVGATPNPETD